MPSSQLILTNIFGIFCVLITFSLGLFALIKGPKKASNISFFLMTLSLDVYYISHLLGINADNAESARWFFMFNLANIFIQTSITHFVYATFGKKTVERKFFVILAYVTGIALFVFFILNPETFMAMPVEKLYIPFYYVPGQYYWLLTAYFMFIATYIVVDLGRMFLKGDWTERNRIKYILGGIIWGYLVGISALLLLYGFPIDPLYSMLFGLYSIPFAYAFLQYEIMDIHVAAKRAVMYASSIATISILLVLINSANEFIVQAVPGFPRYFIPFLIACASVGIATFVWQKIREVDALKYEFITIVTHKFRTPLTYMKWSLDNYASSETEENRGHAVQAMQAGVTRLVELTDLLVSLEKTEGSEYRYSFTDEDITALMRQTIELDTERTATKHITVNTSAPETPVVVSIDKRRLEFALQIILENAISYSPDNSKIDVRIETKNDNAILSITDQGIGISKDELSHMFTKFFRGSRARHVDTEGMGIGLFIAQNIIKHQKGRITVSSDGIGKGTTFTITIPLKN